MKRLIINADDMGRSEEINAGIATAHKQGIVTSTSLIANGDAFNDAIRLAKEHPHLDIGAHLNVFRGTPLTSPKVLVNTSGNFYGNMFVFTLKYILHPVRARREILEEFKTQIQKIQESDIIISHLDTEKHVHTLPFIYSIVLDIAHANNIPVRFPYERITLKTLLNIPQFLKLIPMTFFAPWNKYLTLKSGVKTPERLYGIALSRRYSPEVLCRFLDTLPEGTFELSCHPGLTPKQKSSYIDTYREGELCALIDSQVKNCIKKNNIILIPFYTL